MGKRGQGEGGRARDGDTTAVTAVAAVTTVTPVYSVHRRSMWPRRVMSSARVIGCGMPQWAMWKRLRKPEGSIWPGPLGNLPSHFTFRDKEKQRCNVLARAAIGGPTATACGNSSEPGAIFRRSREVRIVTCIVGRWVSGLAGRGACTVFCTVGRYLVGGRRTALLKYSVCGLAGQERKHKKKKRKREKA